MAKRFFDTEFFKKPLIRSFEGPYKALYAFIICDCDNAGIWNPDCQVASIYVGFNISLAEVKKNFAGKYVELYNGQWFFPGFIKHQYPAGLQISNPAHKKVIEKLKFFDLIDKNLRIRLIKGGAPKELARPSQGSKEEEKDKVVEKEEGKVKEKVKEKPEKKEITFPWNSINFFQSWKRWKEYKKKQHRFIYKSEDTEQAALMNLSKLSAGFENTAVEIINQSIANGWAGLFEIKLNHNGKQSTIYDQREGFKAEHSKRFGNGQ